MRGRPSGARAALARRVAGSLFAQMVAAMVLGVALAIAAPGEARAARLLSDLFLRLISMIVCPLVFCVVIQGIVGAGSLATLRRVGLKAILYFEAITTLALLLGVGLALLFRPGAGLGIALSGLDPAALDAARKGASALLQGGIGGFLLRLVPVSPVEAFARNDVLQVLVLAILVGIALAGMPERGRPIAGAIDAVAALMFRVMGLVIRAAPLGVFGAMAFTTASFGFGALERLGAFAALFTAAVLVFVFGILGALLRLCGLRMLPFLRYFREELLVVGATTSSDAVLPQVMRKLRALGIRREVVGLVIPAGYSFNLDALSLYLGLSVLFLAQVTGAHLSVAQTVLVLAVSLLTSKGAHGLPGMAIVILAATLSVLPAIPPISLVLLLSIDWFAGIPRALGNLVGNCVATVAVASWEGEIDLAEARRVLAGDRGARRSVP
ncbi:cation:dicarboxylase symporter family transporter [Acetobacteraceae bacterium KSS8]|uniref:Cation:dicarboxylase symporter family transporter n=1 Tax=Endosaccharibacter trunci TaxID=2812733 RepID=A0ABT1W2X6_9PROT|nr:cation:dicarboxylase symporter family transporter [Acetobacteraceae bacterium KSS8]